jgi:iron(II)-dependent oxidoreductase
LCEPTPDGLGLARADDGHGAGAGAPSKRTYPWGEEHPSPDRTNLDGYRGGLLDVSDLSGGDSAFGCRNMMGQVWEWTATAFYPFPGFLPDFPYRENSCPWFGYRKVVKGGCWATSAPIARGGYRHSFWPNMDAVFTGFRTVLDDSV